MTFALWETTRHIHYQVVEPQQFRFNYYANSPLFDCSHNFDNITACVGTTPANEVDSWSSMTTAKTMPCLWQSENSERISDFPATIPFVMENQQSRSPC
jgi:hypothetical protein